MRIISWNVCNANKPTSVRNGLKAMIRDQDPDVFLLQETYKLYGALGGLGYQVIQYAPKKGDSERAETVILVRNGLKFDRGLLVKLAQRWKGPKAGIWHDGRWYRWSRVTKDGLVWKIASVHQPFGAGPRAESEAAIRDLISNTAKGRPTFVGGDFNANSEAVRKAIAGKVGAQVVGHGIDLGIYRNCELAAMTVLGKYGSDHSAVMFDLTPNGAEVITVNYGGRRFRAGRRTAAHLERTFAEFKRRFPRGNLLIAQGCYNTGVAASQGTHDKDGVIDFVVVGVDWWAFQRFLRELGWAAWYRHTGTWAKQSAWHVHAISLGCPGPLGVYVDGGRSQYGRIVATSQIDDYYRHTFGLKGQHNAGADRSWFPPDINKTIFRWL